MQAQEEKTIWLPPSVQPGQLGKTGKPTKGGKTDKYDKFNKPAKTESLSQPAPAASEKSVSSHSLISHIRLPTFKVRPIAAFSGKTLWDWMPFLTQLLGIILISASILYGFSRFSTQENTSQTKTAQLLIKEQDKIAKQTSLDQAKLAQQLSLQQDKLLKEYGSLVDQGHEQILSTYLESLVPLVTTLNGSSNPQIPNTQLVMAQTRTNDILTALKADAPRMAIIIQFLHDAGLISHAPNKTLISLNNIILDGISLKLANLNGANFDGASLNSANFSNATLTSSSFRGSVLAKANFTGADLQNADLSGTNLQNANLTGANLKGANISGADLKNAKVTGVIW